MAIAIALLPRQMNIVRHALTLKRSSSFKEKSEEYINHVIGSGVSYCLTEIPMWGTEACLHQSPTPSEGPEGIGQTAYSQT